MDREDKSTHGDLPNNAFRDVPVTLIVSVGRARTTIGTLLSLDRNAVIPLDKSLEDPVHIFAGDRIVAKGDLQEVADAPGRLAVRITEVFSTDETE